MPSFLAVAVSRPFCWRSMWATSLGVMLKRCSATSTGVRAALGLSRAGLRPLAVLGDVVEATREATRREACLAFTRLGIVMQPDTVGPDDGTGPAQQRCKQLDGRWREVLGDHARDHHGVGGERNPLPGPRIRLVEAAVVLGFDDRLDRIMRRSPHGAVLVLQQREAIAASPEFRGSDFPDGEQDVSREKRVLPQAPEAVGGVSAAMLRQIRG